MSLLIRADASASIGTGHVMRCLALTEAWMKHVTPDSDQSSVTLASVNLPISMRKRATACGVAIINVAASPGSDQDADELLGIAKDISAQWVVTDGYHFSGKYQSRVRQAGLPSLVIDDFGHADCYTADIILNQNITAERSMYYKCAPGAEFLLGPDYVLLRREFYEQGTTSASVRDVARHILVTLGGSDPDNVTLKVVRSLRGLTADHHVRVVVGPSNLHLDALRSEAAKFQADTLRPDDGGEPSPCLDIELIAVADNMPELMNWADMAITAGGTTCWELAFMRVPSIVFVLAENQCAIAEKLGEHGVAHNLGWADQLPEARIAEIAEALINDAKTRQSMAATAGKLVDGLGSERVVSKMISLSETRRMESSLKSRPAGSDDSPILLRWANDPVVRESSFNHATIGETEHEKWLKAKLDSPDSRIWIIDFDGTPAAMVRYDRIESCTAKVSFSVSTDFRGRGLGRSVLGTTFAMACKELAVSRVEGFVLSGNVASIKSFERAGYSLVERREEQGQESHVFLREQPDMNEGHYDKRS